MKLLRRPSVFHAWLLAAALLLAQGLGLAHRHAHAAGAAEGWDQAHEAGSSECRLIDQLAHADVLCGAVSCTAASVHAGDAVGVAPPRSLALAPPAAYQARAPPRG